MLPCVNMATFLAYNGDTTKGISPTPIFGICGNSLFSNIKLFFFKVTYPLDLLIDIKIILYYSINTGCRYLSLVKDILEMPLLHYITSEYE